MKSKLIIAVLLLFAGTTYSFGQKSESAASAQTAEQRTQVIVQQMTKNLSLSQEQQKRVHDLVLTREQKRDTGKFTEEDKAVFKKQLNTILTPEQQQKHNQMMQERHKQQGTQDSPGKQPKKQEVTQ
ncbi:MAG TPA: hypothetical protein VFW78_08020 [Bacteroidia bacterium]|nr:hypothetical protein [Bacteroidia bacterium]